MGNTSVNGMKGDLDRRSIDYNELQSLACWNELRTFLAVAKFSSYKGAADALNSSYQTVSRQVKHLESLLKVKLTAATRQGIKLTDKGRDLAEYLEQIDNLIDLLVTDETKDYSVSDFRSISDTLQKTQQTMTILFGAAATIAMFLCFFSLILLKDL